MNNLGLIFEKVFRRLLIEGEAPSEDDLAVLVVRDDPDSKKFVLYHFNALEELIKQKKGDAESQSEESWWEEKKSDGDKIPSVSDLHKNQIVVGLLVIDEPMFEKCNGAWEVKQAAVAHKGLGKFLYGVGYALSPNNKLISDRNEVSSAAQGAWERASKSSRPKKPLDNIRLPREKRRTPDDPSDDCKVFPDDLEFLNYSYGESGDSERTQKFLDRAREHAGDQTLVSRLASAGDLLFRTKYSE